jgi:WD40 repeat protein
VTKIYDRANAPLPVLEILRLSRSGIRSCVQTIAPEFVVTNLGGPLTTSSDGKLLVAGGGPVNFWDPDRREVLKKLATPDFGGHGLETSPDSKILLIESFTYGHVIIDAASGKEIHRIACPFGDKFNFDDPSAREQRISSSIFTHDEQHLLLQAGATGGRNGPRQLGLQAVSRATWQKTKLPSFMPTNALGFFPSHSGKCAVFIDHNNDLLLWSSKQVRALSTLATNLTPRFVEFSPDESTVAVVDGARLRLWETSRGAFVHELRPFEQLCRDPIEGLAWSRCGEYVLAVTKADGFFTSRGISIWNAKTGRHRGELTGCVSDVAGFALCGQGRWAAASCHGLQVWNLEAALAEIRGFESSLK